LLAGKLKEGQKKGHFRFKKKKPAMSARGKHRRICDGKKKSDVGKTAVNSSGGGKRGGRVTNDYSTGLGQGEKRGRIV